MKQPTRAAVYCRLPSPTGNADDLLASLQRIAASRGWHVVATYTDQPTGTASVRSNSPGVYTLLQAAAHRDFEVVVIFSLDQVRDSLREVVATVHQLRSHGVHLYVHEQGLDTSSPAGPAVLSVFAALAECERAHARQRARISLALARRNGVRLGRPSNVNASVNAAIVALRERGFSIRRIASELRVGNRSVYAALEAARTARGSEVPRNLDNGIGTSQKPLERTRNGIRI